MNHYHPSREPQQEPWKHIRARVEEEAQDVLRKACSPEELKQFLQRVPWHVFQLRKERCRSNLEKITRRQGKPSAYVMFGTFTHGGVNGLTRVTREYPGVARCLALAVKTWCPGQVVTSICMTCNTKSHPHRDIFNLEQTPNLIIPIIKPKKGGELWISGPAQEPGLRKIAKQCNDKFIGGHLYPLDGPLVFDPKQWHATHTWFGDRTMLIGYSLSGFHKLMVRDVQHLQGLGFPLPVYHPNGHSRLTSQDSRQRATGLKECHLAHLPQCLSSEASTTHDAHQLEHQERHAAPASGAGGDSSSSLDEASAEDQDRGVEGGAGPGDDRAGCDQSHQQVQDESRDPGALGPPPDSVLKESELRPVEGSASQVLHGEFGSTVQERLYGLRQACESPVWRGGGPGTVLRVLDSSHSPRQSGLPLEIEALPHGHRETAADPAAQRPGRASQSLSGTDPSHHHTECSQLQRDPREPVGSSRAHPRREDESERGLQPERSHLRAGDRAQSPERADQGQQRTHLRHSPQAADAAGPVSPSGAGEVSSDDENEEDWLPGNMCPLPFQVSKQIGSQYEHSMLSTIGELCPHKTVLLEIGCVEGGLLVSECEKTFGKGAACRVSSWNGGDLESTAGRHYVRRMVAELKPLVVWFSPDGSAYSPIQRMNRKNVLGYMDPMYEHRPTSSPTMSRTTRQLFLQCCANHGFQVEKGDISGAFLQGDDFGPDRPMVCEPLPRYVKRWGFCRKPPCS